jgi:hypothetical protein
MGGCVRCHVCRWVLSALPGACCDVRAALLVVVMVVKQRRCALVTLLKCHQSELLN